MTEGTRLVLELVERWPVAIIARRLPAPLRTVYGWVAGARPTHAHRISLRRVFGVPLDAWKRPAKGAESLCPT